MGRYGAPSQLTGIDAQRAMLDELMVLAYIVYG